MPVLARDRLFVHPGMLYHSSGFSTLFYCLFDRPLARGLGLNEHVWMAIRNNIGQWDQLHRWELFRISQKVFQVANEVCYCCFVFPCVNQSICSSMDYRSIYNIPKVASMLWVLCVHIDYSIAYTIISPRPSKAKTK